MKKLMLMVLVAVSLSNCGNETTTTESNKTDSAAMLTVDSVKKEMNRVEDSAERAKADSLR